MCSRLSAEASEPLRTIRNFSLFLALALLLAAPRLIAQTPPEKPAPDVLVFSNGDQLTGRLERAIGDSVLFNSDMAG